MTEADAKPSIEPLLTYKQAGTLLVVPDRTVWTLVDTGQLQFVRFGRSVRFDPSDLRVFIVKSKAGSREQLRQQGPQGGLQAL